MSKDSKPSGSSSSSNSFFELMGFIKKKPALPEGWIVKQSTTYPDRVYFFNVRTGATTWNAPEFLSSDSGSRRSSSNSSEASDKPWRPTSSLAKAAHTVTSLAPRSGATQSDSRQPPTTMQPGKSRPSEVGIPSAKGGLKTLGKKAEGKVGLSPPLVALQHADWLKVQLLKEPSNAGSKKHSLEVRASAISHSPPWGIPMRVSHPTGTLTPESLTPRSLASPSGRDTSSVSSLSSKLGSPTKPKPLPARKKRSHNSSESSDCETLLQLHSKSKQLKATIGPKESPTNTSHSEATPSKQKTKGPGKDCSKTAVVQPRVPSAPNQRDLREQLNRPRQIKTDREQPQPKKQTGQDSASKLPSARTQPPKPPPPTVTHKDKPKSDSSVGVTSKEASSKPKKMSRASWRRKEFRASKKDGDSKGPAINFTNDVHNVLAVPAAANMETSSSSGRGLVHAGPGVASVPAASEDDESSQMEIDLPSESVDTSGGSSNKNLGLCIVLDTNVLMHDLVFVKNLLDIRIPGLGLPHLVIPWVVMQELDSLKNASTKGGQAWNAVQFLHKCVISDHPRVKGEPLRKTSDEADFEITCNDDWILQCCLQQQKKVGKDLAVLLTNDKHLCSKAVISSIKAFSKETLLSGLEALAGVLQHRPPLPPDPPDPPVVETHRPRTPVEPPLTAKAEKELCDELLCQVKETLLHGLTTVMETEMKEAYDELWMEIVIVKPPWSFQDLVQCFEKHWIALFGLFLNKEDSRHFQQIVELTSAINTSLDSVKRLINSSVYFCRRLHNQKRYGNALEQPILRLGEIKKHCLVPSSEGMLAPSRALPSEEPALKLSEATKIVPVVFEVVWMKICQLSALIFEGLGVPHDLDMDKTCVIPSALECHACLDILCPLLQQIIKALERVTEIPDSCVMETPVPFQRLLQTIYVFLREFVAQEKERFNGLTTLTLQKFVTVFSNRQLLKNGIVQLTSALTKLAQCHGIPS
ncbi:transcriptional protein SWT1-like [Acanthaster planci]|uniref:Transcriptional protein SWT1-like n=1 Tax=Acanthaster planci TaxID=133434 RepID=A0A8B7Z343_ACAPL|nr:transcriptional protein SWT1-like [Acanthaster planci]